ncbi:hypothetical protein HK104_007125, partial [Borealophlyctis nickersoniae]
MGNQRRRHHLPLIVNPASLTDRDQPLLKPSVPDGLTTSLGITHALSPGTSANVTAKRGALSEFIVRPSDFMDEDVVLAPAPPVQNPLEAASLPKTRSYKRPVVMSTGDRPSTEGGNGGVRQSGLRTGDDESLQKVSSVGAAGVGLSTTTGEDSSAPTAQPPTTTPSASTPAPTQTDQTPTSRKTSGMVKPRSAAPSQHTSAPRRFRRSDYAKALEPKVLLAYEARPGQTPRKIEIERRKRVFSQQSIKTLVKDEIRNALVGERGNTGATAPVEAGIQPAGGLVTADTATVAAGAAIPADGTTNTAQQPPNVPLTAPEIPQFQGDFLPIEYFDDTEYDERTVSEWLDMFTIGTTKHPKRIIPSPTITTTTPPTLTPFSTSRPVTASPSMYTASVPIPAKALDNGEWRDCLAVAYEATSGRWKVKWRKTEGWEYERAGDEDGEEEDEEDEEDEGEDGVE